MTEIMENDGGSRVVDEEEAAEMLDSLMNEGTSRERGVASEDADPIELNAGIEVEMEHTDDPEIAEKIALDHLSEFPGYYTALAEMEEGLEDA